MLTARARVIKGLMVVMGGDFYFSKPLDGYVIKQSTLDRDEGQGYNSYCSE